MIKEFSIRSKAPLRLGLAGGGTDVSPYCDQYGGAILNATLGMYAYCFIKPTKNNIIKISSFDYEKTAEYTLADSLPIDGSLDLTKYIYNRLIKEFKPKIEAFELLTYSDAPYGSGLGGSSTLVVAIIKSFAEWWRLPLGEYDIAKLAYDIERNDAGLKGGRQDQFAATFGGFNFMEFYADRTIVNPLRIKENILNELQLSLLLCFTGKSRDSANIIALQTQNATNQDVDALAAMDEVKKDAFTMKEAILTGHLYKIAEIIDESWSNKKKMAGLITNSEIEDLYEFAKVNGASAGKVSGAGGGGFMMFCVNPNKRFALKNALAKRGNVIKDVTFSSGGVMSWFS